MIAETAPSNKVNDAFLELAKKLTGKSEARRVKKTMLDPIMARINWKKAG